MLKQITLPLLIVLLLLQYPLWFGKGGYIHVRDLKEQLQAQESVNEALRLRNLQLEGDVRSLNEGFEAIEERARFELGFVREGETFVQFPDPRAPVHAQRKH